MQGQQESSWSALTVIGAASVFILNRWLSIFLDRVGPDFIQRCQRRKFSEFLACQLEGVEGEASIMLQIGMGNIKASLHVLTSVGSGSRRRRKEIASEVEYLEYVDN